MSAAPKQGYRRVLLKISFPIYCASLVPLLYLLFFGERIANVVVHYNATVLAQGAEALAEDLRGIAVPTLAAAALATIAVGLLLAAGLKRAVRRAADPASWPAAARAALASAEAAHATAGPSVGRPPAPDASGAGSSGSRP